MKLIENIEKREKIIEMVVNERERQDVIHPKMPKLKTDQFVILLEEIGEVATAIQNKDDRNYIEELVQVAAYAIRMLEEMKI